MAIEKNPGYDLHSGVRFQILSELHPCFRKFKTDTHQPYSYIWDARYTWCTVYLSGTNRKTRKKCCFYIQDKQPRSFWVNLIKLSCSRIDRLLLTLSWRRPIWYRNELISASVMKGLICNCYMPQKMMIVIECNAYIS